MYPAYKLIRTINRQYPNNGFINFVDANEESYHNMIIDEDFRDIINECLQEIYKDIAIEEMWSFKTVAGQNQYVLPEDCDLRDICEVTRTGIISHPPVGPVEPIEMIVDGTMPPPPMPDPHYGGPYYGWVPNHFYGNRFARRLVWARDAEELTGDRYFNAWNFKRIGIHPTPMNNFETITIYYKKKPKEIIYMDDEVQVKEEFIPVLKYRILMELAKSGSNPDIDMYNVFATEYNNLLTQAINEKDSDQPFYKHVKDNMRPSTYYRRRPWRGVRW